MSFHSKEEMLYLFSAIIHFSLAHNELITFQTALQIDHTSTAIKNITSTSQKISAITQDVTASTEELHAQMHQLKDDTINNMEMMKQFQHSGEDVKKNLTNMSDNTRELIEQMKKIDQISRNVENIANQTNLLSLNAAIEAAHAGEAGRGFSIVANEVRKLAGQTKEAVNEVKQISDAVHLKTFETRDTVELVQSMFKQFLDDSIDIADSANESTNKIEDSAKMIDRIAGAMQEQASALEDTTAVMEQIAEKSDFSSIVKEETILIQHTILPFINSVELNHTGSVINRIASELINHANFLKDTLTKAGTGNRITNHTECAFGRWHKEKYEEFKQIQPFIELYEPHKNFHNYAQKLSDEVNIDHTNQLLKQSLLTFQKFIELINRF